MRLIALGGAPLMQGFALLGFETHPEADANQVEQLLAELCAHAESALVILEQPLGRGEGKHLARARAEGVHIVLVELPPLGANPEYAPPVEALVRRVLGARALEERADEPH
jgi:vacuolar-type H+-ATPase subunit F/Vma7